MRPAGASSGHLSKSSPTGPSASLSGGERKRLVLDLLFASDADVLLLDEPDNYLDVPAKLMLEREIRQSKKTVLMISHDREVLSGAVDAIVTLEGSGAWVHGGSYATYPEAREHRQRRLGDAVKRWHDEERRLYQLMKTFKERARYSSDGPKRPTPPRPAGDDSRTTVLRRRRSPTWSIAVRMRGGDSARRVLDLRSLGIDGLIAPFSDEIHHGERVGLIGPNGSGKSALLHVLAGRRDVDEGELVIGPRVSPGFFTQLQRRGDLAGRVVLDIVLERVGAGGLEAAMNALARYGLAERRAALVRHSQRRREGQARGARLELEGHNLLLLDEPTDNLDIDSSEALERRSTASREPSWRSPTTAPSCARWTAS